MDDFLEDFNQRQLWLLKIIQDQESINSMLVIQKFIYFLQNLGWESLDYEYIRYNYGPFSEELESDLKIFADYGIIEIIEEDRREKIHIRDNEVVDKILRNKKQYLRKEQNNILKEDKVQELFQDRLKTIRNIELAASIHFLYFSEYRKNLPEIIQAINEWKPLKFSRKEIIDVFNTLKESSLLNQNKDKLFPSDKHNVSYNQKVPICEKIKMYSDILNSNHRKEKCIEPKRRLNEEKMCDVALSFAGEDRLIIKKIALELEKQEISYFFDELEESNLWGKDLSVYFHEKYGSKTRFILGPDRK